MVDADAAGMPQSSADRVDEGAIAAAGELIGIERGDAPILPVGAERIGRRADGDAAEQVRTAAPAVAAAAIGTYGEICDKAHRHLFSRASLRGGQALIGQPLQEDVEGDVFGVFGSEALHRRAGGVAQLGRPVEPAVAAEPRVDGVEAGMCLQRGAAIIAVGGNCFLDGVGGLIEGAAQELQMARKGALPVDQVGCGIGVGGHADRGRVGEHDIVEQA